MIAVRQVAKKLHLFQLNLARLFLHDRLRQEHLLFPENSQRPQIKLCLFDHLAYWKVLWATLLFGTQTNQRSLTFLNETLVCDAALLLSQGSVQAVDRRQHRILLFVPAFFLYLPRAQFRKFEHGLLIVEIGHRWRQLPGISMLPALLNCFQQFIKLTIAQILICRLWVAVSFWNVIVWQYFIPGNLLIVRIKNLWKFFIKSDTLSSDFNPGWFVSTVNQWEIGVFGFWNLTIVKVALWHFSRSVVTHRWSKAMIGAVGLHLLEHKHGLAQSHTDFLQLFRSQLKLFFRLRVIIKSIRWLHSVGKRYVQESIERGSGRGRLFWWNSENARVKAETWRQGAQYFG